MAAVSLAKAEVRAERLDTVVTAPPFPPVVLLSDERSILENSHTGLFER